MTTPLSGMTWYCPQFWGWNTLKTPILGAWIGVFKTNGRNIEFHVIETTASILTKFGVTIETTKLSSWVVPVGAQQIQDGGRPSFWKPLNRHISPTVWMILMKFGGWRTLTTYSKSSVKIPTFWKSKMAAAAVLKITKIAKFPQRFSRSLQNLVRSYKMGLLTAKNPIW